MPVTSGRAIIPVHSVSRENNPVPLSPRAVFPWWPQPGHTAPDIARRMCKVVQIRLCLLLSILHALMLRNVHRAISVKIEINDKLSCFLLQQYGIAICDKDCVPRVAIATLTLKCTTIDDSLSLKIY